MCILIEIPLETLRKLLFYIIGIAFLGSCSGNDILTHIPEDAGGVIVVDFKKLAMQSFDPATLFSAETKENNPAKNYLEESGINFFSKAAVFFKKEEELQSRFYFVLPVTDQSKFRNFCKKNAAFSEDKDKGENWIFNSNSRIMIGEKFAIGVYESNGLDGGPAAEQIELLLDLSEENCLKTKNPRFKELLSAGNGIGYWLNLNFTESESNQFLPEGILKGELTGKLEFKKDQVAIEGTIFSSDTAKALPFLGGNLKPEFIANINQIPNCIAASAVSFEVNSVLRTLSESSYMILGNAILAGVGISQNEIVETLSGEVAISLHEGSGLQDNLPEMKILIALKNPANELLAKISQMRIISSIGNDSYSIISMPGYKITCKPSHLEIGVESSENTSKNGQEMGGILPVNQSQIAACINFSKLGRTIPSGETSERAIALSTLWKSCSFNISESKNGTNDFSVRFQTTGKDQNALPAIMKTIDILSKPTLNRAKTSDDLPVF